MVLSFMLCETRLGNVQSVASESIACSLQAFGKSGIHGSHPFYSIFILTNEIITPSGLTG